MVCRQDRQRLVAQACSAASLCDRVKLKAHSSFPMTEWTTITLQQHPPDDHQKQRWCVWNIIGMHHTAILVQRLEWSRVGVASDVFLVSSWWAVVFVCYSQCVLALVSQSVSQLGLLIVSWVRLKRLAYHLEGTSVRVLQWWSRCHMPYKDMWGVVQRLCQWR